ncbi:polyprenyl synthetase family protein, partial [Streptomyces sp. NPDC059766]
MTTMPEALPAAPPASPRAATGPHALAPSAPSASQVLDRCRALVDPALREAVGRLHPWLGEMAAYSFGWCEVGGGGGGPPRPPAGGGARGG